MNKIKLDILSGNKGLLVDLDDTNLTSLRHNGKMSIIKSFQVDIKLLEEIIKRVKERR